MNSINQIAKFQEDRLLNKQEFVHRVEVINILEELFETLSLLSADARKQAEHIYKNYFAARVIVNREELIDCFCDIIVYSVGALMKLNADPECALLETAEEINSRVGDIIDGKFIKDKSPEAQANWYKADYSKCIYHD